MSFLTNAELEAIEQARWVCGAKNQLSDRLGDLLARDAAGKTTPVPIDTLRTAHELLCFAAAEAVLPDANNQLGCYFCRCSKGHSESCPADRVIGRLAALLRSPPSPTKLGPNR